VCISCPSRDTSKAEVGRKVLEVSLRFKLLLPSEGFGSLNIPLENSCEGCEFVRRALYH
jgi:hypothetical protein